VTLRIGDELGARVQYPGLPIEHTGVKLDDKIGITLEIEIERTIRGSGLDEERAVVFDEPYARPAFVAACAGRMQHRNRATFEGDERHGGKCDRGHSDARGRDGCSSHGRFPRGRVSSEAPGDRWRRS